MEKPNYIFQIASVACILSICFVPKAHQPIVNLEKFKPTEDMNLDIPIVKDQSLLVQSMEEVSCEGQMADKGNGTLETGHPDYHLK